MDLLAELLPASFVAVDLACGPGSISQRLLARLPHAPVYAVDVDPVMIALGRGALGHLDGRLHWVEADLASPDWCEALAQTPAFTTLLIERTRCVAGKTRQDFPPDLDTHLAALRESGFAEAGTIWQQLSSRVLLAVR